MAATDHRGVVLLSIKPRFAEAIMRGEKRVEFRRRPWKSDVGTVVVYSTSPARKIVGYFTVTFVQLASPDRLWREHGGVGAIARHEYRDYYAGAAVGVAVGVGAVHRLRSEKRLQSVTGLQKPPQSFAYLDQATLSRLHALS